MPKSLRARLFLSYGGLVLLSVILASGFSLALFALRLEHNAYLEMGDNATRLARVAAALAEQERPLAPEVFRRILRSGAPLRGRPEIFVVNSEGQPVFWIPPQPPVHRPGPPPPADDRPPGVAAAVPARVRQARFPPHPAGDGADPRVHETAMPGGQRMLYVTVPLPPLVLPSEVAGRDPLYLTIARPMGDFRGMWRPMVPSTLLVGSLALLLASVIALALARSITRPLEAMTRASERMADGDYSARVAPEGADEIHRLASAFNVMAQEVGEAHRRQREFVANVGHDLRTPLTTIRGFAEALVDGTARTPAERQHAAAAIEGSAERMERLVGTLIDLARLDSQQAGLELTSISVAELLADVVLDDQHVATLQGVHLAVDAPPGLSVQADPLWLARALGNLVDNAVRHSRQGGEVRLTGRSIGSEVELQVADAGEGIAPADLPHVFERFYRGDPARTSGGSGLGLSIAREIVEAHGGRIAIDSTVGVGTRVTVRLPAGA